MFLRCFSRQSLESIILLFGTANDATHVIILHKYVILTIKCTFSNSDSIFQENNACLHKIKLAKKFHAENDLCILLWSAQSSDLNPIENLQADVKKSIHERKKLPFNMAELNQHVKKAWWKIPIHIIKNLVNSMPQQIQAIIKANKGSTKY